MAKTAAQRKADERLRKRDKGMVPLGEVWVYPQDKQDILRRIEKKVAQRDKTP